MATITLIAALFSLGLTVAVLWINPFRFSNQAFALATLIQTTWLGCVYKVIQVGSSLHNSRPDELEFWFRANAAVASLVPTCVWLVMIAIIHASGRRLSAFLKAWPMFIVSMSLITLSCTTSFITRSSPIYFSRGLSYYIFMLLGICVYFFCVYKIYIQILKHYGIRRRCV